MIRILLVKTLFFSVLILNDNNMLTLVHKTIKKIIIESQFKLIFVV